MHIIAKRLLLLAVGVAVAVSLIVSTGFVARASNPHLAFYSPATDRILWFMQISDTHIGASGSTDSDRLRWVVTTGKTVINPSFIVATGDLTDSTNGNFFGIPNGPYQAEWDQYKSIVDPNVNAGVYYDIPGNHDAYNDQYFSYYVANSVQGRATKGTQVSWSRTLQAETYHFLGINTADNTGAGFSVSFPYGDHAGLDTNELSFISQDLAANTGASLTMVFGHHPVTDTGVSGDTWLFYGQRDFVQDLDLYKASVYGYGHTHAYSQALFKGNTYTGPMADGIAYDNVASLGKSSSNNYAVFAIDCNGVSSVGATTGTWPVVLITAPVDALLGGAPNPYAYSVPAAVDNPIRALVFDVNASPQVSYRIDSGSTYYPMTRVATGSPLWQGTWNASSLTAGSHTIEVRAIGTTTRSDAITVSVAPVANRPPVATNDAYNATSGTALNVAAPGVLGNDTDPDGGVLTATGVTAPTNGTLSFNANGSFTYTSSTGFAGTDTFTYRVTDVGGLSSNIATVTLAVAPVQTKDTVTIDSAIYTKSTKTLAVQARSSSPGTAVLTVSGYGRMTYNSTSKVYTYQKKVGSAPSSVTVTSSLGGSATSGVTVR